MENLEILSSFTTPDELVERILKEKNKDNSINSAVRKVKSYIEKIKSSMKIAPFLIKKRKRLLVITNSILGAYGITISIVFSGGERIDNVSLLIGGLFVSLILSSIVLIPIGVGVFRIVKNIAGKIADNLGLVHDRSTPLPDQYDDVVEESSYEAFFFLTPLITAIGCMMVSLVIFVPTVISTGIVIGGSVLGAIAGSVSMIMINVEKLRLKNLSRILERCYEYLQELQNKLEPLQNPSIKLKKKILEEYLKEEVKKKRDYYLSEKNPIYKADRKLENKLLDTKKLFKEAKQLNEELAINRISPLLKKLKEQKEEIEKLKNNARNTIVKIENVVSTIINSYDKKHRVESLYQKIEDNEKDIENLGMEIDKTSAGYQAHAEVYLKEVMTCLMELAEYSLILNNLKPDTDDMDKIDIILSKQPFKKINKKLS